MHFEIQKSLSRHVTYLITVFWKVCSSFYTIFYYLLVNLVIMCIV